MALSTEYLLDSNEINRPKSLKDFKGTAMMVARLILMNPGTNQLYPKMGVGLVKNFRYIRDDQIYLLQTEIAKQVKEYIPQQLSFNLDIKVTVNGTKLNINIVNSQSGEMASLSGNTENGALSLKDLVLQL